MELEKPQRTISQNSALHLFCTDVARELEAQGIERKTIVEDLADTGVPITMEYVKYVIWYHFMIGMFGKHSTTELDTVQVSQVEQAVARFLAENYGCVIEWPSYEQPE